jgi:hypothetical protein
MIDSTLNTQMGKKGSRRSKQRKVSGGFDQEVGQSAIVDRVVFGADSPFLSDLVAAAHSRPPFET